jgi:hypothetical protein
VFAANENRRRTRSLRHEGQVSAVSTEAVIGRRSSKRCSQDRQRNSYDAIDRRIPVPAVRHVTVAGFRPRMDASEPLAGGRTPGGR